MGHPRRTVRETGTRAVRDSDYSERLAKEHNKDLPGRQDHGPDADRRSYDDITFTILACVVCFLGVIVILFIIYFACMKYSKRSSQRNARRHSFVCEYCRREQCNSCGYSNSPIGCESRRGVIQTRGLPYRSTDFPGNPSPFENNVSLRVDRNFDIDETHRLNYVNETPPAYSMPTQTGVREAPTRASQHSSYSSSLELVRNPVFNDDGISLNDPSQIIIEECLQELYKVTERSITQTVCNKLVVSLARDVDHNGDTLFLDNMGISLKVPKGAVKRGEKKKIVLVLNWDLSDNPSMKTVESLVSPVVYVGPHNLKLEKPCVLSFRHCSFDPRQISVMRSETELTDQKKWRPLCERNEETGPVYLTPDECQLTIDTFTLYTCVQAPMENQIGKKWLQIAVFACPLRKQRDHHQIRVYFLNKTNCALQWAIQNEAKFGGKLVCPEKVFLFDGNDHDMFTLTKYISVGWELLQHENKEKISFLKIWHGHCPHISVCFRRTQTSQHDSRTSPVSIELNLRLLTYQDELEDSAERIFIQVCEDNVTPVNENEPKCNINIHILNNFGAQSSATEQLVSTAQSHPSVSTAANKASATDMSDPKSVNIVVNNNAYPSGQCSSTDITSLAKHAPKSNIPYDVKKRLVVLLDPCKGPFGNDWKDFADAIGKGDMIEFLKQKESPTEELLKEVETRKMTPVELRAILIKIQRPDCVKEIDTLLENEDRTSSREPTENACVGNTEVHSGNSYQNNLQSEESSWTESSSRGNNSNNYYDSGFSTQDSRKLFNVDRDETHYKPNITSN